MFDPIEPSLYWALYKRGFCFIAERFAGPKSAALVGSDMSKHRGGEQQRDYSQH